MANGQEMVPKGQRTSVSQTEQIAITCSGTESKDVRSSGVCLAVCATIHSIRGERPAAWEAGRPSTSSSGVPKAMLEKALWT